MAHDKTNAIIMRVLSNHHEESFPIVAWIIYIYNIIDRYMYFFVYLLIYSFILGPDKKISLQMRRTRADVFQLESRERGGNHLTDCEAFFVTTCTKDWLVVWNMNFMGFYMTVHLNWEFSNPN